MCPFNSVSGSLAPSHSHSPTHPHCSVSEPFEPAYTIEGFKTTDLGIFLTHCFVTVLETFCLAPRGTARMHTNLTAGARGLHQGGSQGLFTPMLFFRAVKPQTASRAAAAASSSSKKSSAAAAAASPARASAAAKSSPARANSRARKAAA